MTWQGERLRDLAKERGMRLFEVADKLSVSRQAVNDWTRGQSPRGTHLVGLSRLFSVSPQYFFSDENKNTISLPLHRLRGVARVSEPMKKDAFALAKEYDKLFKWASQPGLIQTLRVDYTKEDSAHLLAEKLRRLSGIEDERPMDYEHSFHLLESLNIATIFRYFPVNVKGYAFFCTIHRHRVVFVNNNTNVLDLIFPLLHEMIHAIEENREYNPRIEKFCDLVANETQFPNEYVQMVYEAIKNQRTGSKVQILKKYCAHYGHSIFGVVTQFKRLNHKFDLNVGGADTNLKREFPTIGDILFKEGNPREYIELLRSFTPSFVKIVQEQLDKVTVRKAGEWLGLDNVIDARQAIEELKGFG